MSQSTTGITGAALVLIAGMITFGTINTISTAHSLLLDSSTERTN